MISLVINSTFLAQLVSRQVMEKGDAVLDHPGKQYSNMAVVKAKTI